MAGVAVVASGVMISSGVAAQVLEIGAGGDVKVYDGPAVFTSQGVSPILRGARSGRAAQLSGGGAQIGRAAEATALSPDLVAAVAWRESNFRMDRVSGSGAVGEMQLMPATARAMGIDPTDRAQNIAGGATYLRAMMRRYDGDLTRALAAYNAGPGSVDRYHGVPPFKETQAYVAAIMERLSQVAETTAAAGTAR